MMSSSQSVGIAALGLLLSATAAAAPAHAATLRYTAPSGARVEFNSDKLVAGQTGTQRLTFTATGFVGTNPGDGRGLPVLALKFDDSDVFVDWGPLGAGGVPNEDNADQFHIEEPEVAAFASDADGTVAGWVDVPAGLAKAGPGEGVFAGQHWLRVLSGAFSTTGVNLSGDKNVTVPITAKLHLDAVDPIAVGFTNTLSTFFGGTTVPAGPGALTAKGVGFPADAVVAVTLDGAPLSAKIYGTTNDLSSGADGQFIAAVTLPPGASGPKVLRFAGGGMTRDVTLTRVPQTAVHVTSQTVRPGSTVVVSAAGYVGITGAGQKVGLILQPGDKLLGCGQADATGAVIVSGKVPADEAAGAKSLFVAAGAACVAGGPVLEPMPRLTQLAGGNGLTVSATAPSVSSTFTRASAGGAFPYAAEGLAPGESVVTMLDGTTIGAPLTAAADGRIDGSITLPVGTSPGNHVLTLVSNASGAPTGTLAINFQVVAAAKVTLASLAPVTQGEAVSFRVSGFLRGDGTAGQKVGVKVDAGAMVECVQADVAGDGTGRITVPSDAAVGEHTLRFLAGSSCVSGTQNDLPSRSIPVSIRVVAPTPDLTPVPAPAPTPALALTPAPTPTPTPTTPSPAPKPTKVKSTAKGASIVITFATGAGTTVKVGAKTKSKVKLRSGSKARTVTVVKAKTAKATGGKAPRLVLKLTAEGRKLLRARGRLKIVVTIQTPAGAVTMQTFTIKA